MKPKWDDAPGWAEWLAMDVYGNWFWYSAEPQKSFSRQEWWVPATNPKKRFAGHCTWNDWTGTKEHRP